MGFIDSDCGIKVRLSVGINVKFRAKKSGRSRFLHLMTIAFKKQGMSISGVGYFKP